MAISNVELLKQVAQTLDFLIFDLYTTKNYNAEEFTKAIIQYNFVGQEIERIIDAYKYQEEYNSTVLKTTNAKEKVMGPFKVAVCVFEGNSTEYSYRIADYLGEAIEPGMLGIVTSARGNLNTSWVRIVRVVDVLEDKYDVKKGKYQYLVGVVSISKYDDMIKRNEKVARYISLLESELDIVYSGDPKSLEEYRGRSEITDRLIDLVKEA